MKMIVAVDRNWGIGKDGGMLTAIPEDLEFFKNKTMGHVVVMGRKTFESFPEKKALPGRTNIVLTANPDWTGEGAVVVHSREELEQKLRAYDSDSIYIIGGGQVYRNYLERCDLVYVTHIDADYEADTWFPNLAEHEHFVREDPILLQGVRNGISFETHQWTAVKK